MNTSEAAKKIGVSVRKLIYWQSVGWLTPSSNGRDDNNRRLDWSEKDVSQAIDLKNGESKKTVFEATIDSFGGKQFLDTLAHGRSMQEKLLKDEVVIVGPRGARVVKTLSIASNMISMVGLPMVLLPRESI